MDAPAFRRSRTVFPNHTNQDLPSDRRQVDTMPLPELEVLLDEHLRPKGKIRSAASRQFSGEIHENLLLEQFVARLSRDFVGRQEVLAELLDLALGQNDPLRPWGLCLEGEPGLGKSAVFAQLCRQLQYQGQPPTGQRPEGLSDSFKILFPSPGAVTCLPLAHAAGLSPRSRQLDALLRRWIRELAGFLSEDDPAASLTAISDLTEAFSRLLARAAFRTRVICLLDGLDQLTENPIAPQLSWLPALWPENARFIATTTLGRVSGALAKLPGIRVRPLRFLTPGEMAAMAAGLCQGRQKELAPDILAALIARARPDGLAAAGLPLWLKLAVEELLLEALEGAPRGEQISLGAAEASGHGPLLESATRLPTELEALYPYLLSRAEKARGKVWDREFLHLLAVTREGLREQDLKTLLPRCTGRPWEEVWFRAQCRRLRAHLVQQGPWGQWHIAHEWMRQAILEGSLADPAHGQDLHRTVALYLKELPRKDPVRRNELMYHLIGADDRPQAARLYAALGGNDPDLAPASEALAAHILAGAEINPNPGLAWVLSLLQQPGLSPGQAASLCGNCISSLVKVLERHGVLPLALALAQGIRGFQADLAAANPGNREWHRNLARTHALVGDLLRAQGDLTEALAAYQESLALEERLAAADPGNVQRQLDLGKGHERLSSLLHIMGDLPGAGRELRRQQKILGALTAADPGNAELQQALSLSQEKLGDLLLAQDDPDGALTAFRESLALRWVLAAADPRDTGRQRDLAVSQEKLGDALSRQGDVRAALTAYRDALALRQPLAAASPGNVHFQEDLANNHAKAAAMLQALGDLPEAVSELQKHQHFAYLLALADPSHPGRQWDLWASHQHMGEVLLAQGNLAAAVESFQEALRLARRLTAADPARTDWQRNLAISHEKLGEGLCTQGNYPESLREFRQALSLYQRLAAEAPQDHRWQRRLAVCHEKLGDVSQLQQELTAAIKAYGQALALRRRLAEAAPGNARWQQEMAACHEKMGDLLRDWEDLEGALAAYGESLALRQRLLAADPAHTGCQYDLAVSHEKMGKVLMTRGDHARALASFQESLRLHRGLAGEASGQPARQQDLARSLGQVGKMRRALGDLTGALEAFREELGLARQLAAAQPASPERQHYLAACQGKVADLLFVKQDLNGAQEAYLESLAIKEQLPCADPGNAAWQRELLVSYYKLAGATETGTPENRHYLVLCLKTLRGMRARGMLLEQPLPQLLSQLEKKFG